MQEERMTVVSGPTEKDIVYSGLEDTMKVACEQVLAIHRERGVRFRTAAFLCALGKIEDVYRDAGITIS